MIVENISLKRKFCFRTWFNRLKYKLQHPLKTIRWELRSVWFGVRRWWSFMRYGIRVGENGSMLPCLGRGKYVDVVRRGDCIEMYDHSNKENPFTIRLIPYQPNHGVMVEYISADGQIGWRSHCDSRKFLGMGFGVQETNTVLNDAPKNIEGTNL
jgi:hypothetical protein